MQFDPPLAEAESLMARRAYEPAHRLCLEVLQRDPEAAAAWFLLGVLAADHGNAGRAADLFERAAELAPGDPRPRAQLARMLILLNRQADAVEAAEIAAVLHSRDALVLDTLGVVFSRVGLHDRAIPFFEAAVEQNGRSPELLFNLGASRQFMGDFAGAEAAYARAIAIDPAAHRAWSSRVTLARQTPARNFRDELEPLFEAHQDDPERALHLAHALAKTSEDLGDPTTALAWLKRGKAVRRARSGYAPGGDAEIFDAAASTVSAGDVADGFATESPIFVVGLPRTGTTLIDRILSSHREVESLGELANFGLLVKRMTQTPSNLVLDPPTLRAGRGLDADALGRDFMDSTTALRRGAPRFVDKMPINVLYAGLIHRALPDARIVCLRRHPMDSCLANYRQLFATNIPTYDYALDLEDLGRYYLGFDRLVAHWRAVLPPDRFREVAYEDLVQDQEAQTRALLDFCGLDWDPACLDFHQNAAPVATASSVQVRQPLYASSIGRWRSYGEGLSPLRRILEAGGLDVEADRA
ncbi:MAG: sulfotransferase [Phenylobacterium sp.]|nr:sulfotransferase [Phenylobacterium sp.]